MGLPGLIVNLQYSAMKGDMNIAFTIFAIGVILKGQHGSTQSLLVALGFGGLKSCLCAAPYGQFAVAPVRRTSMY
jgi:hypothetical protein